MQIDMGGTLVDEFEDHLDTLECSHHVATDTVLQKVSAYRRTRSHNAQSDFLRRACSRLLEGLF